MGDEKKIFKEWVVLGLMGRRRVGGFATDDTLGGAAVLRIDIPERGG